MRNNGNGEKSTQQDRAKREKEHKRLQALLNRNILRKIKQYAWGVSDICDSASVCSGMSSGSSRTAVN